MKDGGVIDSPLLKGVKFKNNCEEDANIVFKALLKAISREINNMINELDE